LIGTQSLINAGFPNPIAALRNGTIGWLLAQQQLDFGQTRRFSATSAPSAGVARQRARAVADRAGVKRASKQDWATWMQQDSRTTYCFDVRNVAEYATGHLPGCYPIPGGQLVQETEMYAPVRGARIVLVDDDGTRANMSASWLAQMAWDVFVVDGLAAADFAEMGYTPEYSQSRQTVTPVQRYKRPYEGTEAPPEAMQAYLDWEFGLVEQLRRDGTHHIQQLTFRRK
jgi:rhodanese-related sulfurtransferase